MTAALRGTAQDAVPVRSMVPEIDALVASIEGDERKLLLLAGALAVYRRAGYQAVRPAPLPAVAPSESVQGCSDGLAALLLQILDVHRDELAVELLRRLQRKGLRLPHHVLPRILLEREDSVRDHLLPVLGERGYWLATQHPGGRWVEEMRQARSKQMPPDADAQWESGSAEQRLRLMALQRRLEPAAARERIQAVFASEGYEMRQKLLHTLATGLSCDDEPFLEAALLDRSEAVRRAAADLLVRLPDSAYVERMWERIQAVFQVSSTKVGFLPRKKVGLEIRLPNELDDDWVRDFPGEPKGKTGNTLWGWRIRQMAGAVPVRRWLRYLNVDITDLGRIAPREYRWEILEAWAEAALRYGETELLPALWDLLRSAESGIRAHMNTLCLLTGAMRSADLEQRLIPLFDLASQDAPRAAQIVNAAPQPWGLALGQAFLSLQERTADAAKREIHPPLLWNGLLAAAAMGLPKQQLSQAIPSLDEMRRTNIVVGGMAQLAQRTRETWEIRRKIEEMMPE